MDQPQALARTEDSANLRELLTALVDQGRETLELLKLLIDLVTPRESGREGPTLEELLSQVLSQQAQIIAIIKATQDEVAELGATLPGAVAVAVRGRRLDS